jgi:CBS domain-containing protein
MTIKAILEGKGGQVLSVLPSELVSAVVALLAERRIGAVPVIEHGKVCGIFSERDVIYGLAKEGAAILDRKVSEVMTAPAVTVDPDSAIMAGLSMMTRRRIRHLPVVDGDKVVGFVSIGDLVKYRIDKIEAEAAAMRDYIQGA